VKSLEATLSTLFQDGGLVYNNPVSVAVSEARKLWAKKSDPLIVSVECGTQNLTELNSRALFARCVFHSWTKYLTGQREHRKALDLSMKNLWRLDLPLKSDAVRLDDIGSMAMLHKHATLSLFLDQNFQKIIKDTVWSLIASLFYFEFEEEPRRGCSWKGVISCRYPQTPELKDELTKRFADVAVFHVGEATIRFHISCRVAIKLAEVTQAVDVRLQCHSHVASISGLSDTAMNLYQHQQKANQGQSPIVGLDQKRISAVGQLKPDSKRKSTDNQVDKQGVKRLKLLYHWGKNLHELTMKYIILKELCKNLS